MSASSPELQALLAMIHRPGRYFAVGREPDAYPAIVVGDHRRLAVPTNDAELAELYSLETLQKRPGTFTADQISVAGAWAHSIQRIAANASHQLGLARGVSAEFSALIIDPAGEPATPLPPDHRAEGAFATLVANLPARKGQAAEVTVQFGSQGAPLSLPFGPSLDWLAFDTTANLRFDGPPSGWRARLVYDLRRGDGTPPPPQNFDPAIELARQWIQQARQQTTMYSLVIVLETEEAKALEELQSRDAALTEILRSAANLESLPLLLGQLTIHSQGFAKARPSSTAPLTIGRWQIADAPTDLELETLDRRPLTATIDLRCELGLTLDPKDLASSLPERRLAPLASHEISLCWDLEKALPDQRSITKVESQDLVEFHDIYRRLALVVDLQRPALLQTSADETKPQTRASRRKQPKSDRPAQSTALRPELSPAALWSRAQLLSAGLRPIAIERWLQAGIIESTEPDQFRLSETAIETLRALADKRAP